jgi:ribonucleoside-diphosphate reductase alpha chain
MLREPSSEYMQNFPSPQSRTTNMSNNPFAQPISEQIWDMKYRLQTPNPDIDNDESVYDTWSRIAEACADAEPTLYGHDLPDLQNMTRSARFDLFYDALEHFKWLPAGRITAGAGSGRQVTLFNCYVMGVIPDSLSGIFDMLKEAALTMQQGGGIGYDFSPIRPKGATVKGVDADASGPTSFMDVWDAMCKTILSAGGRRGAMMATCSDDHPDIMDFVTAKRDSTRLRNFNVSVLASDAFMDAVVNDLDWALAHVVPCADTSLGWTEDGKSIYEIIRARDLWELIMESTYNYAEPGVLFSDRINKMNNLWAIEKITATNPCGEQPLPPYGACLLGSINLALMVKKPFQYSDDINEGCQLDIPLIRKTARTAVAMLDSVIDSSIFPLEAQRVEAMYKRRMGIGITGLADMLIMMGQTYGTDSAANMAEDVMELITVSCYEESIELARKFGPCPAAETFEQRRDICASGFMVNMPAYIKDDIMTHGLRNALLTSVAPTGTISLYAGNVSSGIEPVFAESYIRKVLQKDGTKTEEKVYDYAVFAWREYLENSGQDMDTVNPYMVTAQTLTPGDHLVMQAAVQRWIDSSISKTINCPVDISFDDFKQVYMDAYEAGLKGCTTYRPNDVTGSVLSIEEPTVEEVQDALYLSEEGPQLAELDYVPLGPIADEQEMMYGSEPYEYAPAAEEIPRRQTDEVAPRDSVLLGATYKLKWKGDNVYVTINNHIDEVGLEAPFEIFINSKKMEHFQWTVAMTRMMSAVFRRGGDVTFIVDELKSVFDPAGGEFVKGKGYVPSFIALLGHTVETHLDNLNPDETWLKVEAEGDDFWDIPLEEDGPPPITAPMQCTSCLGFNVNLSGGCPVCGDCGHSKCG